MRGKMHNIVDRKTDAYDDTNTLSRSKFPSHVGHNGQDIDNDQSYGQRR